MFQVSVEFESKQRWNNSAITLQNVPVTDKIANLVSIATTNQVSGNENCFSKLIATRNQIFSECSKSYHEVRLHIASNSVQFLIADGLQTTLLLESRHEGEDGI